MRTTLVGAALLMFGAGVATVGALDNVALKGSDTLEHFTKAVLDACPAAKTTYGISYAGGGSTTGGNAMLAELRNTAGAQKQTTSPQSRALSTAEGCESAATSEGLVVALDALVISASSATSTACGGQVAHTTAKSFAVGDENGDGTTQCHGDCAGGTYTIADWRDALALIYGGKHHGGKKDCASDARRALVKNIGNLYQGNCASGTCPNGLVRAWRRADLSGTTDTFLSLIGLSSMPVSRTVATTGTPPTVDNAQKRVIDFCNAYVPMATAGTPTNCTTSVNGAGCRFGGESDYLDLDPIRVPCDANEQACGRDGTLGLVTVIEIPANLSNADNFPTQLCSVGAFRLVLPGSPTIICPNGKSTYFGKCFQPVLNQAGGAFTANCIARRSPVQAIGATVGGITMDGRSYNLVSKKADGTYQRDNENRFITGSFYRLHTTTKINPAGVSCALDSATAQIGCLTQANPCSIGFAGREAVDPAGSPPAYPQASVDGLALRGIEPVRENVNTLVTDSDPANDYPLARKLYFNTIRGFEHPNVANGELELAKCMGTNSIAGPAAEAVGFFQVPVGGAANGVFCEDFNGGSCATNPSTNNACANNAAVCVPQ